MFHKCLLVKLKHNIMLKSNILYLTGVIHHMGTDAWFPRLVEMIDNQQQQRVWMSEKSVCSLANTTSSFSFSVMRRIRLQLCLSIYHCLLGFSPTLPSLFRSFSAILVIGKQNVYKLNHS